ncbi:YicC/YloC family endoribonuclease [Aurantimonas sp. C2-6-R+9]|uniref:YicC/YloC family endoribonuclease n=1 Tax=unclassified Aurantimonas TaxID=2638230 RepID=UPI002E190E6A|nr:MULTISPECIES: YicC/YloC family endoribonuclease [unclassified Aurantimonas]MEC5290653.1 YicC/YloC family endoribonuclease [Aurantimonas sp. C2-3-R2]MEC5380633.1 YicC/YloC family endoribonuclease [Aurantimonas sp. C2-6-R+9]MEC5411679.1 YicC/YloC family endoribonuclease [Aurantimonas sp. C2-4-R8]
MSVQSMTGFARHEGATDGVDFAWELRSVNGKGLDLRLRLPPGFEAIEADTRRLAAAWLTRGNIQASLQLRRDDELPVFTVNEAMLDQVLSLSSRLVADGHAGPPSSDGILAIKGIVEVAERTLAPEAREMRQKGVAQGFLAAVEKLVAAREAEGLALSEILSLRLGEIAALIESAEDDPSRSPETIRQRLRGQIGELLDADERLDEGRLHQEAAILAARADIREEIDRLRAHVEAARALLATGGPIGRRLDFLSQEFNRESNTICSKSNSTLLTAIGLELKVVIDQFREQVQNIE